MPELLLRIRKINQMEIEMDKFLAKKNPIFKQVISNSSQSKENIRHYPSFAVTIPENAIRYKINGTILQLTLKSMYEHARCINLSEAAYQQVQVDSLFLFMTCFGNPTD